MPEDTFIPIPAPGMIQLTRMSVRGDLLLSKHDGDSSLDPIEGAVRAPSPPPLASFQSPYRSGSGHTLIPGKKHINLRNITI